MVSYCFYRENIMKKIVFAQTLSIGLWCRRLWHTSSMQLKKKKKKKRYYGLKVIVYMKNSKFKGVKHILYASPIELVKDVSIQKTPSVSLENNTTSFIGLLTHSNCSLQRE